MNALVFGKLLAIFANVGLGYLLARLGWLGAASAKASGLSGPAASEEGLRRSAAVMSDLAFTLFVPALLFRTMAVMDVSAMPWPMVTGYYVPAVVFTLGAYVVYRWRLTVQHPERPPAHSRPGAGAGVMAVSAAYGNAVQLGIPMSTALFGEVGLGLHLALVALHGLILLSLVTFVVEWDLARSDPQVSAARSLLNALRNAVLHPVTSPILLGLLWNATGWALPGPVDEALRTLSLAVVPVCLVLIGVNLAQFGLRGRMRLALGLGLAKLLLLPLAVLLVAGGLLGLRGVPLGVVVMMAALPSGSNALIFAQRYQTREAEATAVIVVTSLAFVATSSLWLAVLHALGQV
jgi:malonate transporter and related proteins